MARAADGLRAPLDGICFAMGWRNLDHAELERLATPCAEWLPRWVWHPALRILGASIDIFGRRIIEKAAAEDPPPDKVVEAKLE